MLQGAQALGAVKFKPGVTYEHNLFLGGAVQVATTGNTDIVALVPTLPAGVKWKLKTASFFTGAQGLAANDTNYLTFTLTNKTNSDAAMIGTDTTKSTAGQGAVTAYTQRSLTLSTTAANLVVDADDVLLFRAAATGTLGAAMPNSGVTLVFEQYAYN